MQTDFTQKIERLYGFISKFGDYRFSRSGDMITSVEIEQEAGLHACVVMEAY